MRRLVPPLIVLSALVMTFIPRLAPAARDQPVDITDRVAVIASYVSRDVFTSEYRYEVSVRNIGADVFVGDSLLLVLDRITNVAGEDREPLKREPILNRMEVVGADGHTEDGKPFFHLTVEGGEDLYPQTECRPVTVLLRNRDYVQVFTPAFRVIGSKRAPPPARRGEPLLTTPVPKTPNAKQPIDTLIQLLIKKGVLTEEEWREATKPVP